MVRPEKHAESFLWNIAPDEESEKLPDGQAERAAELGAHVAGGLGLSGDSDGQHANVSHFPPSFDPLCYRRVQRRDDRSEAGAAANRRQRRPLDRVEPADALWNKGDVLREDAADAEPASGKKRGQGGGIQRVLHVDDVDSSDQLS